MAFDTIGQWSEVKLDIIRGYAAAYSTILANQRRLHWVKAFFAQSTIAGQEGRG